MFNLCFYFSMFVKVGRVAEKHGGPVQAWFRLNWFRPGSVLMSIWAKQIQEQLRCQKAESGWEPRMIEVSADRSRDPWICGLVDLQIHQWVDPQHQLVLSLLLLLWSGLMTDDEFSLHDSSSSAGQHWDNQEGGAVQKAADFRQLALPLIQPLCLKQLINLQS